MSGRNRTRWQICYLSNKKTNLSQFFKLNKCYNQLQVQCYRKQLHQLTNSFLEIAFYKSIVGQPAPLMETSHDASGSKKLHLRVCVFVPCWALSARLLYFSSLTQTWMWLMLLSKRQLTREVPLLMCCCRIGTIAQQRAWRYRRPEKNLSKASIACVVFR